ncbi:respiratory nitrate reductase subunit gamma [Streptomyces lunaelactis]|nr:respiratory nitrate reductase subunit gamma [Streptomyces lunaelactis]
MSGEEHNYHATVSPWLRSVFTLQPDIDAVAAAPPSFQLHTLIGMLLFAIWPFTRLVHAFTAPIGYLFRPYIVYRSRSAGARSRPPRHGWEGRGSSASGPSRLPACGPTSGPAVPRCGPCGPDPAAAGGTRMVAKGLTRTHHFRRCLGVPGRPNGLTR